MKIIDREDFKMNAIEFVEKFGLDEARSVLLKSKNHYEVDVYLVDTKEFTYIAIQPSENDPFVSLTDLKQIVDAFDLVGELGGLERVKNAINRKHIGYTHFYLHSNNRYVFLDHYVDFIPDHAQHIGMFNKAIDLVEKCNES